MTEQPIDILLVEDNPNDIELAAYAFAKNGLTDRVRIVRDGVEAVEFLFCEGKFAGRNPASGPQIVLLDLKLPKMDGFQVLEKIKKNEKTRSIPVIALTTSHEVSDISRSYASGVNSYIVKPVEFKEFAEAIRMIVHYWLTLNVVRKDR
jgi:CheY-like chemotaxis protein